MIIYSYASFGYEGELVTVEVDLRPSLPGIEIVGLPDSAIREAKERIRVAIRNSGFDYPTKRILVNLYPAGLPKTGAAFDLPIALGILAAGGGIRSAPQSILAMGELQLSGSVRGVDGVIAALHESQRLGSLPRLVPEENRGEAEAALIAGALPVESLSHAVELLSGLKDGPLPVLIEPDTKTACPRGEREGPDFGDMCGCRELLRALQIAAAGGHHILLYGPPGAGKSMAAARLPSILPELSPRESLEVTRIYSLAGKLPRPQGLIRRAPFRKPHHSASREGMIGGGPVLNPGEVSLAHRGVLLLDEAAEFQPGVLQALREPVEQRRVDLVRAGRRAWFPAAFQLLLTLNPCPCGNLGREDGVCLCSERDIHRYWRTLGGALLDRIDLRLAVAPADPASLLDGERISSSELREGVIRARKSVRLRQQGMLNAYLTGSSQFENHLLNREGKKALLESARREGLSNRAVHGVLRVALTIADLDGHGRIGPEEIEEAAGYRIPGENAFYSGLSIGMGA